MLDTAGLCCVIVGSPWDTPSSLREEVLDYWDCKKTNVIYDLDGILRTKWVLDNWDFKMGFFILRTKWAALKIIQFKD